MKKTLAAILCIGFFFRILFLGQRQLWTEELLQALAVRASSLMETMTRLRDGVPLPAPLDVLIQQFFVFFLGESAWSLRIHAVVLATLSIWIFYRLGRRLFGDHVALYSTALLAIYPLHYHYSQEARSTALVVLLSLISLDLLLVILAGRGKGAGGWSLLALVLALVLYSSLLGFLVLLAELGFLIASAVLGPGFPRAEASGEGTDGMTDLAPAGWGHVISYASAASAACVAIVPWVRFLHGSPVLPHAAFAVGLRPFLTLIRGFGDNSPFVVILLVAGVACGIRALRRHGRRNSLVLLISWSAITLSGVLVLDVWSAGWYAGRFVIVSVLPLVLVAGYGMAYVGERMTILDSLPYRLSSPAIGYLLILALSSLWIAQSRWRGEPVDWKGAARFLQQQARPGDTIAMPKIDSLLEYYAPGLEEFRVSDLAPEPAGGTVGGRHFDVCLDDLHPDPCGQIRTGAAKDRGWARIGSYRGFSIYVREKKPAAQVATK